MITQVKEWSRVKIQMIVGEQSKLGMKKITVMRESKCYLFPEVPAPRDVDE